MRITRNVLVGAAVFASVSTALAQFLGFMRDSAMSRMTAEDVNLLVKNYTDALNRLPDGHTNAWLNPKTGHSGTATPLRAVPDKGANCRLLEFTNQAGGQSGQGEFTFCKQRDGSWKIPN